VSLFLGVFSARTVAAMAHVFRCMPGLTSVHVFAGYDGMDNRCVAAHAQAVGGLFPSTVTSLSFMAGYLHARDTTFATDIAKLVHAHRTVRDVRVHVKAWPSKDGLQPFVRTMRTAFAAERTAELAVSAQAVVVAQPLVPMAVALVIAAAACACLVRARRRPR